ncbi:hypothetical protein CROQUDRAFT_32547, partial [Cronartium quercuum f. sp. fusiforme G11]
MQDVILLTGITQLPSNLGQSNHGKLKAIQWHTLFAYLLPLVIPELYIVEVNAITPESNRGQILLNISYLCQCTNILCAKQVSDNNSRLFKMFYKKYTDTSKLIFPKAKIQPNHHYALHLGQQLKRWGPLYQVAEFHGKWMVGVLQQVANNGHIGEYEVFFWAQIDKTMMLWFNQLQRLTSSNLIYEEFMSQKDAKETCGQKQSVQNLIELE